MKEKRKHRILFVSQNPGGFQAIFPVYKKLKKAPGFLVSSIFADEARSVSKDKGIQFVSVAKTSKKIIEKKFDFVRPDALLCGTSEGLSIDKFAITIARERNIPSVALIDYWSNYAMRFSDPGLKNLRYLPNWILVMDESTKKQMVREGFSKNNIIVTGNPSFDSLHYSKREKKFPPNLISFFEEPLGGTKEIQIFKDIVNILEELQFGAKIKVKIHPRSSDKNKYNSVIKKSILDIRIDQRTSADELCRKSDLVLGISSMALFRAAMEGQRVVSYQPGNKKNNTLITNALGLSVGVYRRSDLKKQIMRVLQRKTGSYDEGIARAYLRPHATSNVVRFMAALACKKYDTMA